MPRSQNGSIESQRLKWLVDDWNNKLGGSELAEMLSSVNYDIILIDKFLVAGGSCNHFDIIIKMKDGTTKNIEHKAIKSIINDNERPWSLTPQLLNGPYNFTALSIEYCEFWYSKIMPGLQRLFPDLPELPDYESWLKGDATMGSVKTEFGKSLKEIRKNEKKKKIIDKLYKKTIKVFFKHTLKNKAEILELFKKDLTTKMKDCLSQKHLWLNANYETTNTIEPSQLFLTVTPQISNISIDINLNENNNKYPKITLYYNLSSNPDKKFKGEARLRWGNGNGIANIRWNIS